VFAVQILTATCGLPVQQACIEGRQGHRHGQQRLGRCATACAAWNCSPPGLRRRQQRAPLGWGGGEQRPRHGHPRKSRGQHGERAGCRVQGVCSVRNIRIGSVLHRGTAVSSTLEIARKDQPQSPQSCKVVKRRTAAVRAAPTVVAAAHRTPIDSNGTAGLTCKCTS